MGAKQSKRSVDISGKEAESAGEVAAAGAGGEGRVEPLADVDLKPQLNGDAHIQPLEQTDKEKELDSGTPENEKDATTEKEEKDQENGKEKEGTPVTNGESEPKGENGDSSPALEDGKKPKKEKVKKKWSLRSISFSRKDKPKQEKKQKEEEVKTNGEPEKVPEEAAEATPETVESKVADEVKSDIAEKDEKTPETPVTEPITNGSSTPESTKNETPTIEVESTPASPENDRPEVKMETEPEQLPINGLSLEEKEEPKVVQNNETKPEESVVESTETVSAPEIPVKTEVCVEQMPLLESTPPPLPANPPPSSVASFAATTMAPELTDALLANKTETANLAPPAFPDTKAVNLDEIASESPSNLPINIDTCVTFSLVKEPSDVKAEQGPESEKIEALDTCVEVSVPKTESNPEKSEITKALIADTPQVETLEKMLNLDKKDSIESLDIKIISVDTNIDESGDKKVSLIDDVNTEMNETGDEKAILADELNKTEIIPEIDSCQLTVTKEVTDEINELMQDLPPPPAEIGTIDNIVEEVIDVHVTEKNENIVQIIDNHEVDDIKTNGVEAESLDENDTEIQQRNLKNKKKDINAIDVTECNGKEEDDMTPTKEDNTIEIKPVISFEEAISEKVIISSDHSLQSEVESAPQDYTSSNGASETSPSASEEPIDNPQETILVSDKLADLIPEVPVVPELKTELETSQDVAVAN